MKIRTLLAILLVFVATAVAAQSQGPAPITGLDLTPGSSDLSMALLKAVLGDWNGASLVPGVGSAMRIFNAGVMTFGVAMFLYVSVVGIAQTAHDGQVLGKNWSSMWVPGRMVIGTALLAPTPSGFSMIQILVLWVASMGVGLGNLVWSGYVTGLNSPAAISVRMAEQADIKMVMMIILSNEVCAAAADRKTADANGVPVDVSPKYVGMNIAGSADPGLFQSSLNVAGRPDLQVISWGSFASASSGAYAGDTTQMEQIASGESYDFCGTYKMPAVAASSTATPVTTSPVSTGFNVYSWLTGPSISVLQNVNAANSAMVAAQRSAIIQAASQDLHPVAVKLATPASVAGSSGGSPPVLDSEIMAALTSAVNRYMTATSSVAQTYFDGSAANPLTNAIVDSSARAGWINAGMWFFQLAQFSSAINDVTSRVPRVTPPDKVTYDLSKTNTSSDSVLSNLKIRLDKISRADSLAATPFGGVAGTDSALPTSSAAGTGGAGDWLTMQTAQTMGYNPASKNHPIVQLKNTGDYLMVGIETIAVAVGAAATVGMAEKKAAEIGLKAVAKTGFAGVFGNALTGILALGDYAVMIAIFVGIALFMWGLMLSVYLPMVPFIIWVGSVVGWVVTIVEMVFATPIWAAAHLTPEGEGMSGKYGASGYMIVIEIFSKPVLLIFGLIGAMIIVEPVFQWMGAIFFTVQKSVQSNSTTGAISIIAFVIIYTSFCVSLMHRMFSLIHIIPASVMRWIGAHWNSAFDQGGNLAQELQSGAHGSFNQGRSAASEGIGMGNRMRQQRKLLTDERQKGQSAPEPKN